jgi:hypothetical protein
MSETAIIIAIADAMVSELNAAVRSEDNPFTKQFTAERIYDSERELEDQETLRVDVLIGDTDQTFSSRSMLQGDHRIDVAIRQKVKALDTKALDELADFVSQIDDFFSLPPRRLVDYPAAGWIASKVVYYYVPAHIREKSKFTSLLRFTYRVFEKPA